MKLVEYKRLSVSLMIKRKKMKKKKKTNRRRNKQIKASIGKFECRK